MGGERHQPKVGDPDGRLAAGQQSVAPENDLPIQGESVTRTLQVTLVELDRTKNLLHEELAARQQAEFELRKAKGITEATLQAREEFLATMSHELRTPLSVVMGYTDLLKDGEFGSLTEQQAAVLNRVKKNASDLLSLIDALLTASHLQVGRSSVTVKKVRFGKALKEVWEETKAMRDASPLEFIYAVEDEATVFHSDMDKFKVIVRNLLSNASKFTDHGQVILQGRQSEGGVEVCVVDTGIGMEEEEMPFIFKPFHKVGTALTRNKNGAGLGLYIVKNFLEPLKGTIAVQSKVGHGSTFRVWFPMTLR